MNFLCTTSVTNTLQKSWTSNCPWTALAPAASKAEPHPDYWSWAGYRSCLCCCYFWQEVFFCSEIHWWLIPQHTPRHIQQQQTQHCQWSQSGKGSRGGCWLCPVMTRALLDSSQLINVTSPTCWGSFTDSGPAATCWMMLQLHLHCSSSAGFLSRMYSSTHRNSILF